MRLSQLLTHMVSRIRRERRGIHTIDEYGVMVVFQEETGEYLANIEEFPGVCGTGFTEQMARDCLERRLTRIVALLLRHNRTIPRPGERLSYSSAPTERIDSCIDFAYEFMERVLGFEPGAFLLTDDSTLQDFAADFDPEMAVAKVREEYGVDIAAVRDLPLCEILIFIMAHMDQGEGPDLDDNLD